MQPYAYKSPAGASTPSKHHDASTKPPSSASTCSSACVSLTTASSTPARVGPSGPQTPELANGNLPSTEALAVLDLGKSSASLSAMSPNSHSIDLSRPAKTGGIIRRVSNKLRPRASTSNLKNRDQSSGPTVVRGRSSSRTLADGAHDMSDLDLDSVEECDSSIEPAPANGNFKIQPAPRKFSKKYLGKDGEIIVPPRLLQGTRLTKVARKKQKALRVRLDKSHSKLSWSPDGSSSSSVKHLYVDDIREIRYGPIARTHVEEFGEEGLLDRWFTVTYSDPDKSKGRALKALHLLAEDKETCNEWKDFLQFLIKDRGKQMAAVTGNPNAESLTHYWNRTKIQRLGNDPRPLEGDWFTFRDFVTYCRGHSIWKSESDLWALFRQFDCKRMGTLDQAQFFDITYRILERRDIRKVFDSAKQNACPYMQYAEFVNFLTTSQGIGLENESVKCRDLFTKYTTKQNGLGIALPSTDCIQPSAPGMTFESFQEFLISNDNPAILSNTSSPNFRRPLNEYFISSSHNTYLMGRQVAGHSNSEGYIDALKKGCRCVEIDCWDGDDGKPKVTHGRTLSTWTSFEDCIKAIDCYAFSSSRFPLIISLEVHCNPSQQKIMANIMKDRFGAKLLLQPFEEDAGVLPSPEALQGKILIKVKQPKQETSLNVNSNSSASAHKRQRSKSEADVRSAQNNSRPGLPGNNQTNPLLLAPQPRSATFNNAAPARRSTTNASSSANVSSSDDSGSELGEQDATKMTRAKTSNIVPPLGDLGVYTRGIKFSDFRSVQSRTYNHIFSFNENTFEDKCKTAIMRSQLEKHNRRYLMRVYPKGTRYNSSNPDPLQFWRRGVQMVATNWQTYDLGTQINDAMFAAGPDQTGYVLKPEELRLPRSDSFSEASPSASRKKVVQFSVQVLSARRLDPPSNLKSEMNPYVEIEMYSADNKARGIASAEGGTDASARNGMSGIGLPTRRRTQIIESNGYDPVFDQQINLKLDTEYPSLVFVRWTVWHSPDGRGQSTSKEPLASFTAKLSTLQKGYRCLKLRNQHGEETISELFCRIQKENQQDVIEEATPPRDRSPESPRGSEDGPRSGRDILRSVFRRAPSERPKVKKEKDAESNGTFVRTMSSER